MRAGCLVAIYNFYPRPPRGGRPLSLPALSSVMDFYPRPPRGGRLAVLRAKLERDVISIHALREEGDPPWHRRTCWPKHISIHALREEGDASCRCSRLVNERFLSTPSARRATVASSSSTSVSKSFLSTPSARRAT